MSQCLLAAEILPFRPGPAPYPPLDYAVPPDLAPYAKPGARVLVHIQAKAMEGLILRSFPAQESRFKNLKPLDSIFPVPGMDEEGIKEVRAVSEFFGGHLANILDLALPARVQYVEKELSCPAEWSRQNEEALLRLLPPARQAYSQIPNLEKAFSERGNQSFVWDLAQGQGRIFEDLSLLALLSKKSGYSFLACFPSTNLFARLKEAFDKCGLSPFFAGSAEGEAENYRAFLACASGGAQVVGTRKVMHFPVKGPCVLADVNCFGSGSTDGIAPYANVRDVLSIRHKVRGGIRISMAYCHGAVQEKWLEDREACHIFPALKPRLRPACFTRASILESGDRFLHLPSFLVERLRKNGSEGKKSLLVCPAGSGTVFYLCPECSSFIKCTSCGGAVKGERGVPTCRSCRKKGGEWECRKCAKTFPSTSLIPLTRGPERVRQELKDLLKGEALRNTEVAVAGNLPQKPYFLVAILDAWLSFFSLHLDSETAVLNSWMEASSLASDQVILIGECQKELLSSFSNWNSDFPKWELQDRKRSGLPPFRAPVSIWGRGGEPEKAAEEVLRLLAVPSGKAEVLGPMASRRGEELCILLVPPPFSASLGEAIEKLSGPRGKLRAHFWIDPYCFGCR